MAEPRNIDHRGVGDGLSIAYLRDSSPGASTIDLSDGSQTLAPRQPLQAAADFYKSIAEGIVNPQLVTETAEILPASLVREAQFSASPTEQYSQQDLTPLERYCLHTQTHEQLALGGIPHDPSFTASNNDGSPGATAGPLAELVPHVSTSSWSIRSSASGGDLDMKSMPDINSPEWLAMPEDLQKQHLRKLAKLRRRLKTEGSPRTKGSIRLRKRSKASYQSIETTVA
ncbi:hypothetical protein SAMD00023353_1002120 [Rosellinia necatrix]|uniref:Uncharacterized protein n=1 Tax=Rosellinia necatrix TaxID=77044 RepID=A0A1S8A6E1_ROSNE|nr:hypothetical protein SAMD00023353_1002120 [Rosellinia necatrix]